MLKLFNNSRPILWGVVCGALFGFLNFLQDNNLEIPQDEYVVSLSAIVIPFGILAPPILVLLQLGLLRRGLPRWHHWIHRRINVLYFFSLYGLTSFVTHMFILDSIDPRSLPVLIQFLGAGGIGFFIAALIEQRWGQPQMAPSPQKGPKHPSGSGE